MADAPQRSTTTPGAFDGPVDARIAPSTYRAVCEAWRAGYAANDPIYPPLRLALTALARRGRHDDVPVIELLKALNALVRPTGDRDRVPAWDGVRDWAGGVVIEAYYRDD